MAGDEKRFKSAFDSLHALAYFAPEVDQALTGVGLRPGRMPYFAGRSAAMGAVGPEVVAATFYNFNPEVVARVIPRAWTLASPEQVLEARLDGVDGALTRLLGEGKLKSDQVVEATELAREATAGCTTEGPYSTLGRRTWIRRRRHNAKLQASYKRGAACSSRRRPTRQIRTPLTSRRVPHVQD
ncbi:Uncharacterised protein [Amycolatopsis camponoti]|uniref:SalK n=1 Tax=Amycolatopsis camponoti TaxID=2606593 RepID=A0A6I8LRU1_9PSEU|nr:Uncharacterised protein [Amycolatopsis camponoti]